MIIHLYYQQRYHKSLKLLPEQLIQLLQLLLLLLLFHHHLVVHRLLLQLLHVTLVLLLLPLVFLVQLQGVLVLLPRLEHLHHLNFRLPLLLFPLILLRLHNFLSGLLEKLPLLSTDGLVMKFLTFFLHSRHRSE